VKLNRRSVKRGRVEIIPMIDTILILLIFYMSFSTFSAKEKRINSRLPLIAKPGNVAPTEVPLDITIHVHDQDRFVVNGGEFDFANLLVTMQTLRSIGQKATIVIEGNPDTSFQAVIRALDSCAQNMLTNVAFRPLAEPKPAAQP
jgi:biopolymer transport protein ExbD